MFLKKLSVLNFKNLEQAELEFTSAVNCFVGGNGAGKTNLLDAIYYLSMCKGYFSTTENQNIFHGQDFFMLNGIYDSEVSKKQNIVCAFKKGSGKSIKKDGKEYEKLSEHIGLLPIVIITPSDSSLITDAAEERRRYLNSLVSQIDKSSISSIIRYNNLLAQRNSILKNENYSSGSNEILEIINSQLAESGEEIHKNRMDIVSELSPLVSEYYRELSGDEEEVELLYQSELNDTSFTELLNKNADKDRINQFTTSGVHRDDLKMKIGGYPIRKFGSQGQQKSFLIALKLAQYSILAGKKGIKPILLLDDLFDKLDKGRVEKLIGLISKPEFGQIFITDCNKVRLEDILLKSKIDFSIFVVQQGSIVNNHVI